MEPVARGEAACKQGLGVILPVFVCVLRPDGVDDAFAELDWEAGFLARGIMDVVCGRVGYCGCGRDHMHHHAGCGRDAGERCGGESVWVVLGLA